MLLNFHTLPFSRDKKARRSLNWVFPCLLVSSALAKPKDLTEAEVIKKRWQECKEELGKKDVNNPDKPQWCGHSRRARHPEMWSQVCFRKHYYKQLGDGIPAELFQILKVNAIKVLHSIFQLKILQARLQQYMNQELPDVQAEFRKGRKMRDQIAKTHWIIETARRFQKNIYFCFPGGSDSKESACSVGDLASIPGSGRSPGGGNGKLLQYTCLENLMDWGWRSLVGCSPLGHKESGMTKWLILT